MTGAPVRRAAIVGGGVIGGGWAARFLLNGWDVVVHDPAPAAARRIGEVLANARRALPAIYDCALPPEGRLSFAKTLDEATAGADWIQESVPERIALKCEVLARIGTSAVPEAIIGSSTSGFKPSDLNASGGRAIVAHPFVPVYLLPLVELVGDRETTARATTILQDLGMYPLTVRREIDAHIADRLLEAVWREALWLVNDGIATTAEIDEAIRMGFGLRWAQMGLFETYRLGGGEAGMRHFVSQFGPALHWPWSRLTDVPDLTDALIERIAEQSDAQSGDRTIGELEHLRDDNLVAILRALKRTGAGAGAVIGAHERRLEPSPQAAATMRRQVPASWTDAQGKIPPHHYLETCAQALDRFLQEPGVASGTAHGFRTIESRLAVAAPLRSGEQIAVVTEVAAFTGPELELAQRITRADGSLAATAAQILMHVDPATGDPCPPAQSLADRLAAWLNASGQPSRPTASSWGPVSESLSPQIVGPSRTGPRPTGGP